MPGLKDKVHPRFQPYDLSIPDIQRVDIWLEEFRELSERFPPPQDALVLRMLCSRSKVNLRSIRDGFLAERDFPRLTGAAPGILSVFVDDLDRGEWRALRETLGDSLLAALVGISDASLRRYASGQRETPQKVAERLHWLALVVGDLAGSYNAFGIRRWFERPRQQLAGRSPRAELGADWSVDDASAAQVKSLAQALVGANPLAA